MKKSAKEKNIKAPSESAAKIVFKAIVIFFGFLASVVAVIEFVFPLFQSKDIKKYKPPISLTTDSLVMANIQRHVTDNELNLIKRNSDNKEINIYYPVADTEALNLAKEIYHKLDRKNTFVFSTPSFNESWIILRSLSLLPTNNFIIVFNTFLEVRIIPNDYHLFLNHYHPIL
ncbi:MAG TPA: hypothetical protein VGP43_03680 [Chitinophagaceae bacterium]|nr:hypothetical protein [Chitinophagaceae bacterium]